MGHDGSHFEEESWVGLAARMVPADQAASMLAHLNAGCSECANIFRLWSLVAETAARETLYEPPPDVVRAAKAVFPLVQKLPLLPRLAQPIRLMFDSLQAPLPIGVRGSATQLRHLVYETDAFLIDVQLQQENLKRLSVCGQVSSKLLDRASFSEIGLLLTGDDGRFLRHTVVNKLGEFHLDANSSASLTLYMQFPDSSICYIDLPIDRPDLS